MSWAPPHERDADTVIQCLVAAVGRAAVVFGYTTRVSVRPERARNGGVAAIKLEGQDHTCTETATTRQGQADMRAHARDMPGFASHVRLRSCQWASVVHDERTHDYAAAGSYTTVTAAFRGRRDV